MSPGRRSCGPDDSFPGFSQVVSLAATTDTEVYRAVEDVTARPVALKLTRTDSRRPQLQDAFDSEVRALGVLGGHPNVVTLHRTTNSGEGWPALVLELCGGSLAARLRVTGPLDVAEVVATGIKLAGALESAHRAGILHRDVTPNNVLSTVHDEPVLADFGSAGGDRPAATVDGPAGFTTLHAPPEILEGLALSPASDVYGLASTLQQLLTGRAPFGAYDGEGTAAVILRILRDPPAPIIDPTVPYALSDLLRRSLAKDPAQRPERALDLAGELQAIERAAGWQPTTPVVWGSAPPLPAPAGPSLGRPAPSGPAHPMVSTGAGTSVGEAAPPDAPGGATSPPSEEAADAPPSHEAADAPPVDGSAGAGPRAPSVLTPESPPRRVVPPGGPDPSSGPIGPLGPLPPVRADAARLLTPPAPPGVEAIRPTPTGAVTPRPPDRPVRPAWALPHPEEGPLERTVVPDLHPSPTIAAAAPVPPRDGAVLPAGPVADRRGIHMAGVVVPAALAGIALAVALVGVAVVVLLLTGAF